MDGKQIEARDMVAAQLFGSEEEVQQEALRCLLRNRPDLRVAVAVHLYQTDERWSLGGAAEVAGVDTWTMKEILRDRGVLLRLGSATIEEARAEVETVERWLRGHDR